MPPPLGSRCPPGSCLRVVVYVYPTNTTVTALVNDRGEVIDGQSLANTQPEIPVALAELATQIAIASLETAQALGLSPDAAMATMAATTRSRAGTTCERSQHRCVVPVFTWATRRWGRWSISLSSRSSPPPPGSTRGAPAGARLRARPHDKLPRSRRAANP